MDNCEEIMRKINDGCTIACSTKQETQQATMMLLDLGFRHGESGYSRKYVDGDIEELWDEDDDYFSWYANPLLGGNEIEYTSKKRPERCISYADLCFLHSSTMVDEDFPAKVTADELMELLG